MFQSSLLNSPTNLSPAHLQEVSQVPHPSGVRQSPWKRFVKLDNTVEIAVEQQWNTTRERATVFSQDRPIN